jgi:FixJ family two-component response regulator
MENTPRSIAVVDDNSSLLTAIERLLSTRSWVTKTFQSGQQFLASLTDGLPDCLILDLHMPEMNGLEVQQMLISKGIDIPTIIVTSNMDAAVRERCLTAGAIAYLPKPVRPVQLFAAIEAALADAVVRTKEPGTGK